MKKIIATATAVLSSLLIATTVFALTPYAFYNMHVNPAGTGAVTTFSNIPALSTDGVATIDGTTNLLTFMLLGSRLSLDHTANALKVDLTAQPESNITNLTSDLANKLSLPTGTTSQYLDGTGALQTFPSITAPINPDWNATSGLAQILNKPSLFSGSFSALTGIPSTLSGYGITDAYPLTGNPSAFLTSVPAQSFSSLTGKPTTIGGYGITDAFSGAYSALTGIPTFSTVATTGAYSDLIGKPTIPAAQVQTDWNAITGIGVLLNKPILSTVATSGAYTDLSGKPTLVSAFTNDASYITSSGAPVQSVSGRSGSVVLTSTDVGLSNVNNTSDTNKPVSTAQAASIATKFTIPTGTTSQVVLGDGTLGTLPVVPTAVSSTYQGFVTQTGTSNPTGTQFHTDFGATTFTWARTGVGAYTLTASSPVFTSNKTAVLMSMPNNPLAAFKYTVTSSTVLTFGTSVQSLASLLTLNLTTTPTDALFANTMIYVIVYP